VVLCSSVVFFLRNVEEFLRAFAGIFSDDELHDDFLGLLFAVDGFARWQGGEPNRPVPGQGLLARGGASARCGAALLLAERLDLREKRRRARPETAVKLQSHTLSHAAHAARR